MSNVNTNGDDTSRDPGALAAAGDSAKRGGRWLSRRRLLTGLGGLGAVGVFGAAVSVRGQAVAGPVADAHVAPATGTLPIPPLLTPVQERGRKVFRLRMQTGQTTLKEGYPTASRGFNGPYLGPTVKVNNGDRVRMEVTNRIGDGGQLGGRGTVARQQRQAHQRGVVEGGHRVDVDATGQIAVADPPTQSLPDVRAAIIATQAVVRHMTSGGSIITIGSNAADRVPGPGGSVYAASKSALTGLTRGLAHEFGPRGITAVVVQPGPTDTDTNPADGPHARQVVARTPLGNYGHVDDIAEMVTYLAGPGGRHITGTTITLDGGFNA